MAIAVIKDFDNKLFTLNNIKYVRNFIAVKSGENVRISNAYDTRFSLVSAHYSEYTVNDNIYFSAEALISVLSPLLFVKDELTMSNGGESSNNTINAVFSNINGTWINTPNTPGSGNINLDLANAVNGGVAAVYYKGNLINNTIFIGGTIVILSGENLVDELCIVFIIYDKVNNGFSVNIQTGFIELPIASEAPAQMLVTDVTDAPIIGDGDPPATMAITSIEDLDTLAPATMAITETT